MLTAIENENAPTQFSYVLNLGPGQRLAELDGDVVILNGDGSVEFAVAPAWAVDAKVVGSRRVMRSTATP